MLEALYNRNHVATSMMASRLLMALALMYPETGQDPSPVEALLGTIGPRDRHLDNNYLSAINWQYDE